MQLAFFSGPEVHTLSMSSQPSRCTELFDDNYSLSLCPLLRNVAHEIAAFLSLPPPHNHADSVQCSCDDRCKHNHCRGGGGGSVGGTTASPEEAKRVVGDGGRTR